VSKLPEGAGDAFGVGAGVRAGGMYRGAGVTTGRGAAVAVGAGVAVAVGTIRTGAGFGAATTLRRFGFGFGFGGLRGSRRAGTGCPAFSASSGAAPGCSTSGDGAARTAAFGDDERPSICKLKHALNTSETKATVVPRFSLLGISPASSYSA
jgi:hypothetical protein